MLALDRILQECKEMGREPLFRIDGLVYQLTSEPATEGDMVMDARDAATGVVDHVSPMGYTAVREYWVVDLVPTEYIRKLQMIPSPTIAAQN